MAQVSNYIFELVRTRSNEFGTFGRLFFNDEFVCYTLEPAPNKDKDLPIPLGTYKLSYNIVSPKFRFKYPYCKDKGLVPRLLNVPRHSGILIHIGNFLRDTSGCILVGMRASLTRLFDSTVAYSLLISKIKSFHGNLKVIISSL